MEDTRVVYKEREIVVKDSEGTFIGKIMLQWKMWAFQIETWREFEKGTLDRYRHVEPNKAWEELNTRLPKDSLIWDPTKDGLLMDLLLVSQTSMSPEDCMGEHYGPEAAALNYWLFDENRLMGDGVVQFTTEPEDCVYHAEWGGEIGDLGCWVGIEEGKIWLATRYTFTSGGCPTFFACDKEGAELIMERFPRMQIDGTCTG